MYQLNVYIHPGSKTSEGHTHQGWAKFQPEYFDQWELLEARQDFYIKQGINARPGDLSAKIKNV
jgi:hypothetical protein